MMQKIPATMDSVEQIYLHAVTRFDPDRGISWCYMNQKPRPCITLGLLADVRNCQHTWEYVNRSAMERGEDLPIRYGVLASLYPGVFSYGGDLELFIDYIQNRDREGLRAYARMCIEDVYLMSVNLHLPMTTISLVQGDALGGGFEAALSCNVLIAEKQAQFGLPEILFNLFPGMGAYSILSRKLGPVQAEKVITSGAMYSATQMYEMGVVDILAEDGEGESAVHEYVAQHTRKRNAFQSILKLRHRVHPVSREEMMDIGEIWVDAAMDIGPKDRKLMERLVKAQKKVREELERVETVHEIRA
jgi:DSF synthase